MLFSMASTLTTKVSELKLAAPAVRALEGAKYLRLGQLAGEPAAKLEQLHGMGANALEQVRDALAVCGMTLADETLPLPQTSDYAQIGDLKMYYNIQGDGQPLVMLHGGMLQSGVFSALIPHLLEGRKIITIDQQAHGRTADIDRPLSFEQMADDTAALLKKSGVKQVDVFGYSEGGVVALELAIRHPQMVRKLVLASAVFDMAGYHGPVQSGMKTMTEKIVPKRMRLYYQAVAPQSDKWAQLVKKSAELAQVWPGIATEKLKAIKKPALVIMADKDYLSQAHGAKLAELLGAQFAVLTSSSHMSYLFSPKKLLTKLSPFLNKR